MNICSFLLKQYKTTKKKQKRKKKLLKCTIWIDKLVATSSTSAPFHLNSYLNSK